MTAIESVSEAREPVIPPGNHSSSTAVLAHALCSTGLNVAEPLDPVTTIYGTPLDPTPVGRAFAQALERAGLTARKLHNTRHTYATLLFAQGEHPKVVQEQLGHATIAITLDIYSAYIPTMGRSAAARMEAVLTTPCAADRAENS